MDVMASRWARGLVVLLIAGATACAGDAGPDAAAAAAAKSPIGEAVAPREVEEASARVFDQEETHADHPPHGGAVVALGSHLAHAEVAIVPDSGEVSIYVLDGEGVGPSPIAQPTILAEVQTSGRTVTLEFTAVADEGSGERPGNASHFTARSDDLLRTSEATVILKWVGVKGQVFSDVVVDWPAGTE